MRSVVQRVSDAHLTINRSTEKVIGPGLVVLLGMEVQDGPEDVEWLSKKISMLRIFNDPQGMMNLSLTDVQGALMVVSQFTLHASTKKGNRPSFIRAAPPASAIPLYESFILHMEAHLNQPVVTGEFGAYMQVRLTNDGPVTIVIDTKNRE